MAQIMHDLLSIAPMIDWTYSHFRMLMRMLAPKALLYTEMLTAGAILNNNARFHAFNIQELPLALQLGGVNRDELIKCAQLAEKIGYSEINLNLGCPSDRVLAGQFGACLMTEPQTVVDIIRGLKDAVTIPVTAKTRIGVDSQDSYEFFADFVYQLVAAGSDKIIVHARKAWLNGLSPKQNRTIPPVQYDYVYRIKQTLQSLPIIINGNIQTVDEVHEHLKHVDGVMLGRVACNNPYQIAILHHALYQSTPLLDRKTILRNYANYILTLDDSVPVSLLIKPIFNMAHNLPFAKAWKKALMQLQSAKSIVGLMDLVENFSDT